MEFTASGNVIFFNLPILKSFNTYIKNEKRVKALLIFYIPIIIYLH